MALSLVTHLLAKSATSLVFLGLEKQLRFNIFEVSGVWEVVPTNFMKTRTKQKTKMEKVVCDSVWVERMWIKDLVRDLRRRKFCLVNYDGYYMAIEDLDSAIVVGVLVVEDSERERVNSPTPRAFLPKLYPPSVLHHHSPTVITLLVLLLSITNRIAHSSPFHKNNNKTLRITIKTHFCL